MNTLTINPRFTLLVALTASVAGTATTAAETLPTERVIVDAAGQTTIIDRRSESGATIEEMQLRGSVNYSDLDPSIPSNAKVLKTRVHDAAREVCQRLDQMYPVTTENECTQQADKDAMPQVTAAISKAETRKRASL